ncbi:MAG: hypothetical protein AAGL89_10800 [Pseudomonadota bacterium]
MPTIHGRAIRGSGTLAYGLPQAAALAQASYSATRHKDIKPRIARSIDQNDVQATLLDNGLLLVPGSNSAWDYLRYNVRLLNVGGRRFKVKNGQTGQAMGRLWHQGFLAHAMLIHEAFKSTPPRYIIGHSLGAASAQVLSLLWGVPAVGFAAPRLYAGGRSVANHRKCLCLWRKDDPVGSLPGQTFRHAGKSVMLAKSRRAGVLNHHMRHYRAAISDPNHAGILPKTWPVA